MINPLIFYHALLTHQFTFFTGVPDSLLNPLCNCIRDNTPKQRHIIAANEGNAVAIASGYQIATGNYGVVYMQNSGIGNAVNPLLSLVDQEIYQIPMLFIIGWRGEPDVQDEPQHRTQGKLTIPLLETMGIRSLILTDDFAKQLEFCQQYLQQTQQPIALIVKTDTFEPYHPSHEFSNGNQFPLSREQALEQLLYHAEATDFFVTTTGKTSRELFELRERQQLPHHHDFLTVGSMGHATSLALGMSLFQDKIVYCIDGDGAFLMHMGGVAVAIQTAPKNFKYILINNGCHESVGKQPTIAMELDFHKILTGFGFQTVLLCKTEQELVKNWETLKNTEKAAMIIYTNDSTRKNLGRPTLSPIENKQAFQAQIRKESSL